MSETNRHQQSSGENVYRFATTQWSVVISAGDNTSPNSQQALETLCPTYWYPLYAYVRRRIPDLHQAQDLTQEFFATLLEKKYLRVADREKGRFRSFLLPAFKRFLSKQYEKATAHKRGGGRTVLSLDFDSGEQRYKLEPSHDWTPEKIYQRRWAVTLLDQVLARLNEEYTQKGKQQFFSKLKVFLTGQSASPEYSQLSNDMNMSEGAVKVAVHRLRKRYRQLLKEEIANTVADSDQIGNELDILLAALRGEIL